MLGCVALSVDILLGYAGLLSLGQAAYFGLAAYIAALMYLHVTQSFWLVLLTVCARAWACCRSCSARVAIRAKELLRAHHLRCRRDPVEDHPQHARSAAPTA